MSPRPASNLPAGLPSIAHAKLPAVYENAREMLAKCERIDECRDWANKADAIASYAKQAEDDTLLNHATRIKGRAIKRCGELLREIPPAPGGRPTGKPVEAPPQVSRSQAAREAGLSRDQKVQALRVAAIPEEDFERLVESDRPPTITELAERGTKPKPRTFDHLQGRRPDEYAASTRGQGELRRLVDLVLSTPAAVVVRGALDHEVPALRRNAELALAWLGELFAEMESKK